MEKNNHLFSFSSCHANTVVPSKVIWQRQGSPGFGFEGSSQKQTDMCHLTVGTSGCTQSATSCSSFSSLMLTKRQEKRKGGEACCFSECNILLICKHCYLASTNDMASINYKLKTIIFKLSIIPSNGFIEDSAIAFRRLFMLYFK